MNFTREPIIETVITPREGCKLVIRSSKGVNQEDYFVDAVEVVSFGHSFFYRSTERPKAFLVPVSDYELLELKETRMVLKNVGSDRSIKIGGGRETSIRHQPYPREPEEQSMNSPHGEETAQAPSSMNTSLVSQERMDKKQGRRRSRRRRGGPSEPRHEMQPSDEVRSEAVPMSSSGVERAEEPAPLFISKLFPPPPTLIKETLSRYKPVEESGVVETTEVYQEGIFEHSDLDGDSAPRDDEETKFDE